MRCEPYQFRTLVDDEITFLEQIPNVSLRTHKCFGCFFFSSFPQRERMLKKISQERG